MSLPKSADRPSACPPAGETVPSTFRSRLLKWLFPLTGLAAAIWFLIRVIPKPSRATYPCQRAAFPLASGFVIWLLGLGASALACRKAVRLFSRASYIAAAICVVAAVACVWMTTAADTNSLNAVRADGPFEPNKPIGEGRGVHPGRVAWIYDANAAKWPGDYGVNKESYWYSDTCTNPLVVKEMLSKALRTLTGAGDDHAAWDAIFRDFNKSMGKGDVGYKPGEKIAIKTNWVTMLNNRSESQIDDAPQLAIALLKQLIDNVGVAPGDISIGDPQNTPATYWYNMVHAQCPGVVYLAKSGTSTTTGRTPVAADSNAPFYFSDPCTPHWSTVTRQDYIPNYFAKAQYFINFPIMKSHNSAGITVAGKNHYGSLMRAPNASGYYNMHNTRPSNSDSSPYYRPGMGYYRANVDLMGHPKLGGKTLLVLMDGLYGGRSWDSRTIRWNMPPFNGNWPSSIFLSQDQVASDSVAFDFMVNEWKAAVGTINGYPQYSGTEDYLHEAALVPNPPSGTKYDPNHDGGLKRSLGVHEHWNNPVDKQYSRNLDPNGTGIELATKLPLIGDFDKNGVVDANDATILAGAMFSEPGDDNWNPACDISEPSDNFIDMFDQIVFDEYYVPAVVPADPNEK